MAQQLLRLMIGCLERDSNSEASFELKSTSIVELVLEKVGSGCQSEGAAMGRGPRPETPLGHLQFLLCPSLPFDLSLGSIHSE